MFYLNMENRTSNISFTSNIKFINHARYTNLRINLNGTRACEMNKLEDTLEIANYGETRGIMYCIGVILKDLKTKNDYICHWHPGGFFKKKSNKNFGLRLKQKLKHTSHEGVKGLIVGGLSKDVDKRYHYESLRMFNLLKKGLQDIKQKDFSMFLMQSNKERRKGVWPHLSFIYSKKEDTYFIYYQKDRSKTDLITPEEIRNHFDYIHISPNDSVFVGDNQIPNSFLNKKKQKN